MANIVTRNQPLPQNPLQLQKHPVLQDAYTQCLLSERGAHSAQELMYARCLGYFLLEMPGPNARHMVADEIFLCECDKGKMEQLAQLYINHVIRLCESTSPSLDAHYSLDVRVQSERTKDQLQHPRITPLGHLFLRITVFSTPPRLRRRREIIESQNVL
jgi:hypothetical protein